MIYITPFIHNLFGNSPEVIHYMTDHAQKISVADFLELADDNPVVDVRSPSEYRKGHIPCAVNIPLFDDETRAEVGIAYKQRGRGKAILKGLELAGPGLSARLEKALHLSKEKNKLLVYCWRGGMRSETMAWLFSLGDIDIKLLEGGYKAYRHYVLDKLAEEGNYVILGGLTGSGKTEILRRMKEMGHQVIDLEKIASHKGSAFGSLGQSSQPSSEHFSNLLFDELRRSDTNKKIWLEDESKNIGSVFIPDSFYDKMQSSPVVALIMDIKTRLPRLLEEYSGYPPEDLKLCIQRISKRLGGDNARESIGYIETGNFSGAIEMTLKYYDKMYMYGLRQKREGKIKYVETATDNIESNISKILESAMDLEIR
jgi:tRNA 2-selenouridine synthase